MTGTTCLACYYWLKSDIYDTIDWYWIALVVRLHQINLPNACLCLVCFFCYTSSSILPKPSEWWWLFYLPFCTGWGLMVSFLVDLMFVLKWLQKILRYDVTYVFCSLFISLDSILIMGSSFLATGFFKFNFDLIDFRRVSIEWRELLCDSLELVTDSVLWLSLLEYILFCELILTYILLFSFVISCSLFLRILK